MQLTLSQAFPATDTPIDTDTYSNPNLRLFVLPFNVSHTPLHDLGAPPLLPWTESSRVAVIGPPWERFSAVCYFFGEKLYRRLKVPIGESVCVCVYVCVCKVNGGSVMTFHICLRVKIKMSLLAHSLSFSLSLSLTHTHTRTHTQVSFKPPIRTPPSSPGPTPPPSMNAHPGCKTHTHTHTDTHTEIHHKTQEDTIQLSNAARISVLPPIHTRTHTPIHLPDQGPPPASLMVRDRHRHTQREREREKHSHLK